MAMAMKFFTVVIFLFVSMISLAVAGDDAYVPPAHCYLKPEVGMCRALIPMHFYDPVTKSCSNTFMYGGCGGNGNAFDTERLCELECSSTAPEKTTEPETTTTSTEPPHFTRKPSSPKHRIPME